MRLIKLDDLNNIKLCSPILEADAPPFAILSHTWAKTEDELSFQDMTNVSRHKHKSGYHKIQRFCKHARQAGYRYAWADTVCIDKTSSAELSEAINSMYRWYSISTVCYVFLEDLGSTLMPPSVSELELCRWFTRGWTLQELLAPEHVVFLNRNWNEVGRKKDLRAQIADITGIDLKSLSGRSLKRTSVARRMSWASERKTSRPEDAAYCLLGIFGINMPLLYGEGERAFIRLQEEILRSSIDQSIFAWSAEQRFGVSKSGFWGLLAPSPAFFKKSRHIVPIRRTENAIEISVTSRGISLDILTNRSGTVLMLDCRLDGHQHRCTIPIVRLRSGGNEYARRGDPGTVLVVPFAAVKSTLQRTRIFVRNNLHEEGSDNQDLINYMELVRLPGLESGYEIKRSYPATMYEHNSKIILTSPFPNTFCGAILSFEHRSNESSPFMVAFCADALAYDDDDRISQDVVAVMNGAASQSSFEQFRQVMANSVPGQCYRATKMLQGVAKRVRHGGVGAWQLDDGTFVRVSVRRDGEDIVDSIAVGEVFVGTSWASDIVAQDEQEMPTELKFPIPTWWTDP